MGLTNPAGSFNWYECPKGGEPIKIFSNSFWGNGKNCKKCKIHIPPMTWNDKKKIHIKNKLKIITVYDFKRKMCPICKRKLACLDPNHLEEGKYCIWSHLH